MKILKNLKINNENKKINASEVALVTNTNKYKSLDNVIGDLSSLNTTDNSNIIGAINNLVGYTIYDNSTGTSDNFTLNDSVANYKFIEVYFKQDGYYNGYKSQKLYEADGKTMQINYFSYHVDGGRIQFFGETISFSGVSATVGNQFGYVLGNQNYGTLGDTIKVVKIIGYK